MPDFFRLLSDVYRLQNKTRDNIRHVVLLRGSREKSCKKNKKHVLGKDV